MFIAAFDISSPESLLIHLMGEKAEQVLEQFAGDYSNMANYLRVINKRLVLLNPVRPLSLTVVILTIFSFFRKL